jgi:hypothetical protein
MLDLLTVAYAKFVTKGKDTAIPVLDYCRLERVPGG